MRVPQMRIGRRGSPPPPSIRGPASIGRWADMPASKSMEIYSSSASQARAGRQPASQNHDSLSG